MIVGGMGKSTDSPTESELIWETMAQVFNSMMRNGTLTHFSGFTDITDRRKNHE